MKRIQIAQYLALGATCLTVIGLPPASFDSVPQSRLAHTLPSNQRNDKKFPLQYSPALQ